MSELFWPNDKRWAAIEPFMHKNQPRITTSSQAIVAERPLDRLPEGLWAALASTTDPAGD